MRNRFCESHARLQRHRNQTLTAIILLHRGEAQARVCFRFCGLDARANSRKPPKACICTQITALNWTPKAEEGPARKLDGERTSLPGQHPLATVKKTCAPQMCSVPNFSPQ